jgi:hypothetical protein
MRFSKKLAGSSSKPSGTGGGGGGGATGLQDLVFTSFSLPDDASCSLCNSNRTFAMT